MDELLAQRKDRREELIALARDYVDRLSEKMSVLAAAVVGSVARGDFNVWSDIDVVVMGELPPAGPARSELLLSEAVGGIQPIGFTPEEYREALKKNNRLVIEVLTAGVILKGKDLLTALER